jgi:hypothetical protein
MQNVPDQSTLSSPSTEMVNVSDHQLRDDHGYAEYFRLAGIKNVRNAQQPGAFNITDEDSESVKRSMEGGLLL